MNSLLSSKTSPFHNKTSTLNDPCSSTGTLSSITSTNPTIILHFQLPNGSYRTLELPLAMFHRLRYNVAVLLSEMQALENRAVMKKF